MVIANSVSIAAASFAISLFTVAQAKSGDSSTASYQLMRLVNTGTQTRSDTNKSSCFALCTDKVSAVSHSMVDNTCVISYCGNLILNVDARWETFVCSSPVTVKCSYPRPKFQWMITDTCGHLNTGWHNTGLPMPPSVGFQPTSMPYTVPLGSYTGLSVQYPGTENYNANTPVSNLSMDFRKSYTLFAYFNSSSTTFALIEFGEMKSDGYYVNEQFEIESGQLYHNFVSGCDGSCRNFYSFTAVPNTWTSAAMVFDESISTIMIYMNGTLIGLASIKYSLGPSTSNVVVTGGRPTSVLNDNYAYGSILGSTRCIMIFDVALSAHQIKSVSDSCIFGQLHF